MELELFKLLVEYPFVYRESFYDSNVLIQNKTCRKKCKSKDCLVRSNFSDDHYVCSKGYDNRLVKIEEKEYLLNGLILDSNHAVPKGRKEVRKQYILSETTLIAHIAKIKKVAQTIRIGVNERMIKNLAMFHDFKSSMNIFFDCTHDIIASLPGETFESKLEKSPDSYNDLYNALQLITSQLGMIDVVSNPQSIKFGVKKSVNLYRMFDKYRILFNHHRQVDKKSLELEITSNRQIDFTQCFDSIEFLPLILLDNAIKYSSPHSKITIRIEQYSDTIQIAVKNIGPFVKDANESLIFNKFYRSPSGETHARKGLGVGLWVANTILKAHDSTLKYDKDRNAKGEIGLNIFEFDLKVTSGNNG